MEVQPSDEVTDDIGPFAVIVDGVDDSARRFHRQGGDDWALAVRGTVEIREMIPRQMLLNRLSSSRIANISQASVLWGSRMDSALSRNRVIS